MIEFVQNYLVLVFLFSVVVLGLNLIVGHARVLSVNQAALFGIGAFTYAAFTKLSSGCLTINCDRNALVRFNLPHDVILVSLVAAVLAAVLSAIVALVALRIAGDYFIVASFGLQLVVIQVIYNMQFISGGPAGAFGLPYPTFLSWQFADTTTYLWVSLIALVLAFLLVSWVGRSPYGRLVRAMGQDERAVESAGFSIRRLKLSSFILGGVLAAIAGVLYAGYLGIAQTVDYNLDISITLLAMLVIGGTGSNVGAVLGVAFVIGVRQWLQLQDLPLSLVGAFQQLMFGVLLVLVVVLFPGGLIRVPSVLAALLRGRPVGVKVRAPRALDEGADAVAVDSAPAALQKPE